MISVITSDIELLRCFMPIPFAGCYRTAVCHYYVPVYRLISLDSGRDRTSGLLDRRIVIPMMVSRYSGENGLRFRTKSGDFSGFVLDSLRGLSEILQYGQGKKRLFQMNEKTDELSKDEEKMKDIAGKNTAVTNTVVLTFDLMMLFVSTLLYQKGAVGFEGVLIPTLALFSSFGPVIALAALAVPCRTPLRQVTGYWIFWMKRRWSKKSPGKPAITFSGAKAEHVSFSYGDETILSDVSVTIPENAVIGHCRQKRQREIHPVKASDAILEGAERMCGAFR